MAKHRLQFVLTELSDNVDLGSIFKSVTLKFNKRPELVMKGEGDIYQITLIGDTYHVKRDSVKRGVIRQSKFGSSAEVLRDFMESYLPSSRWPFTMSCP